MRSPAGSLHVPGSPRATALWGHGSTQCLTAVAPEISPDRPQWQVGLNQFASAISRFLLALRHVAVSGSPQWEQANRRTCTCGSVSRIFSPVLVFAVRHFLGALRFSPYGRGPKSTSSKGQCRAGVSLADDGVITEQDKEKTLTESTCSLLRGMPETFFDELPTVLQVVPSLPGEEALYGLIKSVLDSAASQCRDQGHVEANGRRSRRGPHRATVRFPPQRQASRQRLDLAAKRGTLGNRLSVSRCNSKIEHV